MSKQRSVSIAMVVFFVFSTLVQPGLVSASTTRGSAAALARLALPPIPGKARWDESSIQQAFDPANVRGRNPVYAALGIKRQALQGDGGAGSANFFFSVPILDLPGRGLDLALNLNYNSRLWFCTSEVVDGRCTGKMIFNPDDDWPAPGWSLSMGKMIGVGGTTMLIDPDGTRHECIRNSAQPNAQIVKCHTADGSLIDVSQSSVGMAEARYPDGKVITFSHLPGETAGRYATQITDANGNVISISYRNEGTYEARGRAMLDTITDTLGRVVRFYYDQQGDLTAIEGPGFGNTRQTLLRLHYQDVAIDERKLFPLDLLYYAEPVDHIFQVRLIDALYYPGTHTGYWFGIDWGWGRRPSDTWTGSYSPYGMLREISEDRNMNITANSLTEQGVISKGIVTRLRRYDYPAPPTPGHPNALLTDAPVYTTMTETWEYMNTPGAVTHYLVKQGSPGGSPAQIEVTYPDKTRSIQRSYNAPGQFNNGLVYNTQLVDSEDRLLQEKVIFWEQGDLGAPRIKRVETFGETGQKAVAENSYGPEHNQVTEVRNYDNDGVTLLRRQTTEYVTDAAYSQAHIFNLPKRVQVFDGASNTPAALIEYTYDESPLLETPGVTSHAEAFDPALATNKRVCIRWETEEGIDARGKPYKRQVCREYKFESTYDKTARGNVTTITRYADAANKAGPVIEKRQYDITGNVVGVSGDCCVQTTFTYDQATQYTYPTVVVRGSNAIASTARMATTTQYDLNTGLTVSSTDANGDRAQYVYQPDTERLWSVENPAGSFVGYQYDDATMTITETARLESGQIASQVVKRLNGLGLDRRVEVLAGDNAWNAVETQYDVMGRVWKQSRPFRQAPRPESADELKYWDETTYDALGRVIRTQATDGSTTTQAYNETTRPDAASAMPGQTARTTDPWGRERWTRTDALGRLVEVVMPNPAGIGAVLEPGSIATQYRYDALGRLVESKQGPLAQVRRFRYDSLGRLTHQRMPERLGTLDDAGKYLGPGGQWSDVYAYDPLGNVISYTDARGAKVLHDYKGDPLNRLQSITYDLTGVGDPSSPVLPAGAVHLSYATSGDVTRPVQITTDGLSTEDLAYDSLGRLAAKTLNLGTPPGFPLTVGYTYDSLNRLTQLLYPIRYGFNPAPQGVQYAFGATNQIQSISVDGQDQASFAYDFSLQPEQILVGAAGPYQLSESYAYDPKTQLLSHQSVARNGSTLLDLWYDYTNPRGPLNTNSAENTAQTGQVTRVVDNVDPAASRTYTYDAWGRLATAQSGSSQRRRAYDWLQQYTYDAYGNRTDVKAFGPPLPSPICRPPFVCPELPLPELPANQRDGLGPLTFDATSNRITTPGFAYDAAGNQIRSVRSDGHGQQYRYDAAGRLVQVLDENGTPVESYEYYNTTNMRLTTRVGDPSSWPKLYIWQGNAVIAEYQATVIQVKPTTGGGSGGLEPRDSGRLPDRTPQNALQWIKSYVYAGDRLLSTRTPDAVGKTEVVQYHHPDRISTRLIANANSNEVVRLDAFPYGNLAPGSGVGGGTRYFTSYDRSAPVDADYAVNRYYAASQARFTQADPLGLRASSLAKPQSLNLYSYVENDPVNAVDPLGLRTQEIKVGSTTCYIYDDGHTYCFNGAGTVASGTFGQVFGASAEGKTGEQISKAIEKFYKVYEDYKKGKEIYADIKELIAAEKDPKLSKPEQGAVWLDKALKWMGEIPGVEEVPFLSQYLEALSKGGRWALKQGLEPARHMGKTGFGNYNASRQFEESQKDARK